MGRKSYPAPPPRVPIGAAADGTAAELQHAPAEQNESNSGYNDSADQRGEAGDDDEDAEAHLGQIETADGTPALAAHERPRSMKKKTKNESGKHRGSRLSKEPRVSLSDRLNDFSDQSLVWWL